MADATGTFGDAQVKNPDAVQQSLLGGWHWLEKHAKLVAALIGVLALFAIAWVIYNWYEGRQERKAQDDYYAIESKFTKIKDGFEQARFQAMLPQLKDQKEKAQPATGDLAKDFGTLVTDLETFARSHAGTTAGAQAALLAAETYIEYKQPEKAIEIAQVPIKGLGDRHLISNLARVVWGNALVAKGSCQEAVGVWQKVLDTKAVSFLHPDTSLRSGICFEEMNQPDKAAEMYRKVTTESADSAAASTAKGLLRALELKKATGAAPAKS